MGPPKRQRCCRRCACRNASGVAPTRRQKNLTKFVGSLKPRSSPIATDVEVLCTSTEQRSQGDPRGQPVCVHLEVDGPILQAKERHRARLCRRCRGLHKGRINQQEIGFEAVRTLPLLHEDDVSTASVVQPSRLVRTNFAVVFPDRGKIQRQVRSRLRPPPGARGARTACSSGSRLNGCGSAQRGHLAATS